MRVTCRWTIDGHGDSGTRTGYHLNGKLIVYNVSRSGGGFWLSEKIFPDGSVFQLDASERSEAGAHARCEMDSQGRVGL